MKNKDISNKKVDFTYVIHNRSFDYLQKKLIDKGYEWLDSGGKIIKNQYSSNKIYISCWENKVITYDDIKIDDDNRCSTSHKYIYNYDRILKMKRINETN